MKYNISTGFLLQIMFANYIIYYYIGYLLNTDIWNAITINKDGFTISFLGISLLLFTTHLIMTIVKSPNI